jgi:hypothetical protein
MPADGRRPRDRETHRAAAGNRRSRGIVTFGRRRASNGSPRSLPLRYFVQQSIETAAISAGRCPRRESFRGTPGRIVVLSDGESNGTPVAAARRESVRASFDRVQPRRRGGRGRGVARHLAS